VLPLSGATELGKPDETCDASLYFSNVKCTLFNFLGMKELRKCLVTQRYKFDGCRSNLDLIMRIIGLTGDMAGY
jgi:hypothetical protein